MTKTVPMFINARGEAYCQYCLEGIDHAAEGYTTREREMDECHNCHGEHTPADRDYAMVEVEPAGVREMSANISGYECTLEIWYDCGDKRTDCFITSRDGKYTGSLQMVLDQGELYTVTGSGFKSISNSALEKIEAWAERNGW